MAMPVPFRPQVSPAAMQWAPDQSVMVRDQQVFVRFGSFIVPIVRHDFDEWMAGPDNVFIGRHSVWIVPSGRQFHRLADAIEWVRA